MEVSIGIPTWLVHFMENPIYKFMILGVPLILGNFQVDVENPSTCQVFVLANARCFKQLKIASGAHTGWPENLEDLGVKLRFISELPYDVFTYMPL